MARGTKPRGKPGAAVVETPSSALQSGHPLLCLRYTQSRYGIDDLTQRQRSEFVTKWAKRAKLEWKVLGQHVAHGLGFEHIPAHKVKRTAPDGLRQEKYMVMRHEGNHSVVGFKTGDVFHVLWIEAEYGDVYDHG